MASPAPLPVTPASLPADSFPFTIPFLFFVISENFPFSLSLRGREKTVLMWPRLLCALGRAQEKDTEGCFGRCNVSHTTCIRACTHDRAEQRVLGGVGGQADRTRLWVANTERDTPLRWREDLGDRSGNQFFRDLGGQRAAILVDQLVKFDHAGFTVVLDSSSCPRDCVCALFALEWHCLPRGSLLEVYSRRWLLAYCARLAIKTGRVFHSTAQITCSPS